MERQSIEHNCPACAYIYIVQRNGVGRYIFVQYIKYCEKSVVYCI